jgi:hypothetical protein
MVLLGWRDGEPDLGKPREPDFRDLRLISPKKLPNAVLKCVFATVQIAQQDDRNRLIVKININFIDGANFFQY